VNDVRDPALAARRAVGWMHEQLSRPVVRREWIGRAAGRTTEWIFTDTGRSLGRRGARWRTRRPPDVEVRLWPEDG
jgi:hypothetical protein